MKDDVFISTSTFQMMLELFKKRIKHLYLFIYKSYYYIQCGQLSNSVEDTYASLKRLLDLSFSYNKV